MEDGNHHTSGVEHVSLSNLRTRNIPDVPEDVPSFVERHLNDPNFDLYKNRPAPPPFESLEGGPPPAFDTIEKKKYPISDIDGESHYDSTSRAESRNSTAIEFDE